MIVLQLMLQTLIPKVLLAKWIMHYHHNRIAIRLLWMVREWLNHKLPVGVEVGVEAADEDEAVAD